MFYTRPTEEVTMKDIQRHSVLSVIDNVVFL